MDEQALRGLITEVKVGKLSRRAFVQKMVALGLTAPMASQMLAYCGRGTGAERSSITSRPSAAVADALKVLWWQGATLLNPHFAVGTKDQDGSRIFYEPLAGWDPDGESVAGPRSRNPEPRERRTCSGRHVRHLEAQEGRAMA